MSKTLYNLRKRYEDKTAWERVSRYEKKRKEALEKAKKKLEAKKEESKEKEIKNA